MSSTVWKFPLTASRAAPRMPAGARIIAAAIQNDQAVVWAIVNPDAPQRPRPITAINTGDPLPEPCGPYIATITTRSGVVWHLFDS